MDIGYSTLYPPETQTGNGNLPMYGLYVHLFALKMVISEPSMFD